MDRRAVLEVRGELPRDLETNEFQSIVKRLHIAIVNKRIAYWILGINLLNYTG